VTGDPSGPLQGVERLRDLGQGHLLEHAATLPPAERERFLLELRQVPWEELLRAFAHPFRLPVRELRPPPALTWKRQERQPGLVERLADLGTRFVAGGRVATMLLAGGQGTRLGASVPKGLVVLGPGDDDTLYAVHARRVREVSERTGREVPLLVAVSRATRDATVAEFERRGRWGLGERQVSFVAQEDLPALDDDGRALLSAPGRLASAPDGHGGCLRALARGGFLADLLARGVDAITTFQVDNPLALPLDPVMLGWMVERRAVAVGKAVRRRDASEKVGVFARDLEGRVRVVEYSEAPEGGLPPELVLGSIALHAFGVRWLHGLLSPESPAASDPAAAPEVLPLHRARKKVPWMAPDGRLVEPDVPNAWKLERFAFDVFPHAPRAEVHEVLREREFAPVKNATGEDSLETARALVAAEERRRAGAAP
jgi:UDP-N-acetylglucosamine/UDP-N-acetylgalactosamine diphosphorylase